MGIREHTTYSVECDVCGVEMLDYKVLVGYEHPPVSKFRTQLLASKAAVKAGWTVDTFSTKCRNCVGIVTREEPWWSEVDE